MAAVALAVTLASACGGGGDEPQSVPRLRVSVFGWGPDDTGQVTFVEGMPAYEEATSVRVRITDPANNEVVAEEQGALADRAVKVPSIEFGEGLRLDLEVLNAFGEVVASGATPAFDFTPEQQGRSLRMMVMPTNEFAPAGSLVSNSETGERTFVQSRLDYRSEIVLNGGATNVWLGRVGHASVPTSDGKVLIVGGADVIPGSAPGTIPKFRKVYGDVQIFDPETGYFTDLSFNEEAQNLRPGGKDRLSDARAYHTVTPIGEDRFLVAGGYTKLAEQSRPVRTLELINLNAPAGERVTPVVDSTGTPLQVNAPRGFHQSVFLEDSGQLVMIGGVGESSEDIRTDIEVVDLAGLRVIEQRYEMNTARTDHAAVGLGDGTIWILGGRNADGALASTEVLSLTSSGVAVEPGPEMGEPRFKMGAARIEAQGGTRVVVVGGFTSLDGDVTGSYEIGVKGFDSFISGPNWALEAPRGGHSLVVLPQTQDVLVLGGQDAARQTITTTERLLFNGLTATPPYDLLSGGIGSFVVPRYGATFTVMSNGQVLVFGGVGEVNDNLIALDSAEIYNPRDPVGQKVLEQ